MGQVDRIAGLVGNLGMKAPCNCATTGPITLSGEQTIDGYAATASDNGGAGTRVLVKDQADATQNGIYYVSVSAWSRAPDWDGARDAVAGTTVPVSGGSTNANKYFAAAAAGGTITPGTTSVTFTNTVYTDQASVTAAAGSAAAAAASAAVIAGFAYKGSWLTATNYAKNNLATTGGATYICLAAHTSGTFNTDLGNGLWALFAQAGTSTGGLIPANNLSDLVSAAAARTNLGLGTAAVKATGTTAGSVPVWESIPLNSVVAKSAGYTVVGTDRGALFNCTGTFTLALTAAATLGAGFVFAVRNSGTGVVTVDPNLAETIDGTATLAINAGESALVICDGAGFTSVGHAVASANGAFRSMQVFLASGTYTAPAGLVRAKVTVVGGGGGGGSARLGQSGGGGGGGWAIGVLTAAQIGGSQTVTVGGGGGGGNGGAGGAGGTSSLGALVSATGGGGGGYANNSGSSSAGAGGGGSGGSVNGNGGRGQDPLTPGGGNGFGGGGGGSLFGGAAPSQMGNGAAGFAAVAFGSGGGGCIDVGGVNIVGGAGAAGIVIVEEFF